MMWSFALHSKHLNTQTYDIRPPSKTLQSPSEFRLIFLCYLVDQSINMENHAYPALNVPIYQILQKPHGLEDPFRTLVDLSPDNYIIGTLSFFNLTITPYEFTSMKQPLKCCLWLTILFSEVLTIICSYYNDIIYILT